MLLGDDDSPRLISHSAGILSGHRILIATPVDGESTGAMAAVGYGWTIAKLLAESRDIGMIDPRLTCYPADVVRARSRMVRIAQENKVTGVLWIDSDAVPKEGTLGTMLASGHDVVGCPYPRKRVHWDRVKRARPGEEAEWHAYEYCYHRDSGPDSTARVEVVNGCIPIARMGFGCMYTSMRALNAVCEHFADDDWFVDVVPDGPVMRHYECVAIFGLLFSQTVELQGRRFRALYSEDYSFCERYAVMRESRPDLNFGPAQMLVSHPADHSGTHLFRGAAEGLVYAR